MKRRRLIVVTIVVPLVLLVAWIANNTYWEETKVPLPPTGEALTNPFYAAQRFAEALGADTRWDRALTLPDPNGVVVLHAWHWTLSSSRRATLERWVEAGGRLVVDDSLAGGEGEFERWSGIRQHSPELDDDEIDELIESIKTEEGCRDFEQQPVADKRRMCEVPLFSNLVADRPPAWTLRDETGIHAVRVAVGRGSVTRINATPFHERNLFDGDHAWLFAAATQLRRGDRVLFITEKDHPSLLALLWQHGAPALTLALLAIALALWRGGVRFGPLAAAPDPARRSLAEQIRGTGQFVLRHGSGDALLAACVRALNEAAQQRVPHYAQLSPEERVNALARLTGFDRNTLSAAVHSTGVRRSHNLRSTLALIESVRRQLVRDPKRAKHPYGT